MFLYNIIMNSPSTEYNKLEKFITMGNVSSFLKGELIATSYKGYDTILLIKSGLVKRYLITAEGKNSVQSIYGPGQIFPLTPVFKALFDYSLYEGPETLFYEAMNDVEVYGAKIADLRVKCDEDPLYYRDLLKVSGERLASNIQKIENISLHATYNRVAHQLHYFAREFGVSTSGGTKIDIPLKHQDIAEILSITRETVSRDISHLKNEGLILVSDSHEVTIPDMKKLETTAYEV